MDTIAYLLALDAAVESVQVESIKREEGSLLCSIKGTETRLCLRISDRATETTVINQWRLSHHLVGRETELEDLLWLAKDSLERLFIDVLSDAVLEPAKGSERVLYYRVRNRPMKAVVDLNGSMREIWRRWQAARLIREGYTLIEELGLNLYVKTPSGILRTVTVGICQCNEYEMANTGGRRPDCKHLVLADVYRQNRSLFRKYGLVG